MHGSICLSVFLFLFFASTAVEARCPFPREQFGRVVLSQAQVAGRAEAPVGAYNTEPISGYSPVSGLYQAGRAVGRLDILTKSCLYPCTGFLISEKHLITNYHCVPGILENDSVSQTGARRIDQIQFVLGYTLEGLNSGAHKYPVLTDPVEKNKKLDYAILEVFGNPSKRFGKLKIANLDLPNNLPLWIIGHPLGGAQIVSREQCKSSNPAIANGRLRHTCDTFDGSSGSPVIDPDSGSVVALHYAGSASQAINFAVPMSTIVKASPLLRSMQKLERQSAAQKREKL